MNSGDEEEATRRWAKKRESNLGCYIIVAGLVLVAALVLINLAGLIFGGGFDPS